MATYVIVQSGTASAPNEIDAGSTIAVQDGDVFIVAADADDDITFQSASGSGTDFSIRFDSAGSGGDYDLRVGENLTPDITVADGVDISNVAFQLDDADASVMTVGDGATISAVAGSDSGADRLSFGDAVTVSGKIDTDGGDDVVIIGDDSTYDAIDLGDGDNSLSAGDDNDFDEISSGDGADTLVFGDWNTISELATGGAADHVTVGLLDTDAAMEFTLADGSGSDGESDGDSDSDAEDGEDGDNHSGGDTLQISLDPGDVAAFESLLSAESYEPLTGADWAASDSTDNAMNWGNIAFNNVEMVRALCFAAGTRILTPSGQRPVESLRRGDVVTARDGGLQPIVWIGHRRAPARRHLAPVRIRAGTLGNARDLWLSPQHRVLLRGAALEMAFGVPEALAPAVALVNGATITRAPRAQIDYYHILLDRHDILFAEGAPCESFYPSAEGLVSLGPSGAAEVRALFPELAANPAAYGPDARYPLRGYEAELAGRLLRLDAADTDQPATLAAGF